MIKSKRSFLRINRISSVAVEVIAVSVARRLFHRFATVKTQTEVISRQQRSLSTEMNRRDLENKKTRQAK